VRSFIVPGKSHVCLEAECKRPGDSVAQMNIERVRGFRQWQAGRAELFRCARQCEFGVMGPALNRVGFTIYFSEDATIPLTLTHRRFPISGDWAGEM